MAGPVRTFGPAVNLSANTTMTGMVVILTDGTSDFTFSTSLPSLTSGIYTPHGFANHIAKKIRQYIKDRCDATVAITTKPTLANIDVSIGWPQSSPINVVAGVNTSPLRLHIGSMGGAASAVGLLTIKSFRLNNTNGWGSLWGWCNVAENRIETHTANVINADGRFQPRFIYVFRCHVRDTGNMEVVDGAYGDDHADMSATYFEFGEPSYEREITLMAHQRDMTGPQYKVGIFSSFGATRNIFNLQSIDETLLNGMTGTYKRTDHLTAGQYLRLGKTIYPVRYKETSSDSFVCYETIPTSITVAAGTPIFVVSEAHALTLEWRRTGLLIPYEPIDSSGLTSWMGDAYIPNRRGEWRITHDRAARPPLYNFGFAGLLSGVPGFATP